MTEALERARRSLLPTVDLQRVASSSALGGLADVIAQNQRSLSAIARQIESSSAALRLTTNHADLGKAIAAQASQARLSVINPKVFDFHQVHAARWRSVMESLDSSALRMKIPNFAIERISRSALVWDSGISEVLRRFTDTGILARANLGARLLEPSRVFSAFTEDTLALMRQASEPRVLRALSASLTLADAQHLANVDALSSFATEPVDDEVVSTPRDLRAPFVQQEELLELSELDEEEDVDLIVARSPMAQAAERARAVLTLTTSCNKAHCVKNATEIFKPTTKVMEVFTDLPWLAPQDERSFGEFIDCLYFVIYEGAGKDKLRFLTDHGGPLPKDDCKLVWCIKILRNKWLRHDIDHGKQSDIERGWGDLGSYLQWLGLSGYPKSAEDYRRLHDRLLMEAEVFLSKLLSSI